MIKSLKTRMAVWYAVLSTAILLSFGAAVYFTLSRSLYREREDLLRESGEQIRLLAQSRDRRDQDEFLDELDERLGAGAAGEFIEVFSADGANIYMTPSLKGSRLPFRPDLAEAGPAAAATITALDPKDSLLLVVLPVQINNQKAFLELAVSLSSVRETQRRLLFILMVSVPIAVAISLLGGSLLARRAIKPVDQMTETARRITAENLNERIALKNADEELSRMADAFNQMVLRLEESFEQIRQFTADASHELRTPLAILTTETQLALERSLDPNESRQVFRSAMEELARMTRIVDDLLVLSRFDSKRSVLDLQRVDFSDILIETCEQMRNAAEAKGLELTVQNVEPFRMMGDPLRLRQAVRNLLDNAIKYSSQGGRIRVTFQAGVAGAGELAIEDDGIGIPASELPRIFDRFYRVDKARSRALGGSGLGLSIVKRVVEAHGGTISIESQPGAGTKVHLTLPASG